MPRAVVELPVERRLRALLRKITADVYPAVPEFHGRIEHRQQGIDRRADRAVARCRVGRIVVTADDAKVKFLEHALFEQPSDAPQQRTDCCRYAVQRPDKALFPDGAPDVCRAADVLQTEEGQQRPDGAAGGLFLFLRFGRFFRLLLLRLFRRLTVRKGDKGVFHVVLQPVVRAVAQENAQRQRQKQGKKGKNPQNDPQRRHFPTSRSKISHHLIIMQPRRFYKPAENNLTRGAPCAMMKNAKNLKPEEPPIHNHE